MISINLTGGLGNQMFVYAAGLKAARRLSTPLRVFIEPNAPAYRPYLLDKLRVPQENVVPRRAVGVWEARYRRRFPDRRVFKEKSFHYDTAFEAISDGSVLDGYFQSWRYSAGVSDLLHEQFRPRDPLSDNSERFAQMIHAAEAPISLHIRRGDYLQPIYNKVFGVLDDSYYSAAISLIRSLVGASAAFFVFSSDDDWEKSAALLEPSFVHVVGNTERPWEDQALMSMCHHHIIANSSFGWWGAWLNPRPQKRVVAPRNWFTPDYLRINNTSDLYPENWILL